MAKIKSLNELIDLKEAIKARNNLRLAGSNSQQVVQIKVAMATCGIASGAKAIKEFIVDELEKRSIDAVVTQTGCMGYCYAEPTIEITLPGKEPLVFGDVTKAKADEIIERYIKNGELVDGIIPVTYKSIAN